MKKILFFILTTTSAAVGQNVAIVKFPTLQKVMESSSDKIQVINFWATWCAPCVKELPYFEALNTDAKQNLEVTLVNLDFADKLDKVNGFLIRKNMKTKVLLLDEIDYNSWIDKVDRNWSGAIPATLIINFATGKRKFVEKELDKDDLDELIREVL